MPVVMVLAVCLVPSYYARSSSAPRPLTALVRRMEAFADVLQSPQTTILQGEYAYEISSYVGHGKCRSLSNTLLLRDWPAGVPLEEFLARRGVNAMYLDNLMLGWLEHERPREARAFLSGPLPAGWKRLGGSDKPGDRWRMYQGPAAQARATLACAAGPGRTRR
jgi:hypothetical protein